MIRRLQELVATNRMVSAASRRVLSLRRRLERSFVVVLAVRTMREMSEDDATHMAAGVSYYALFSIFPLLLGLIALLSLFLDADAIRVNLTAFAGSYLPASEQLVATNIEAVLRLRGALGLFAMLGLLWSGSAIFGALTRAINRAWDVQHDRPLFISKLRQLAMAFGVGALFLLSVSATTLLRFTTQLDQSSIPGLGFAGQGWGRGLLQGSSFFFTLCIFLVIYKFVPNTTTHWRYIWPGALLAALLFEVAKNVFIAYLNRFTSFESVYGSLAPVIVLLLWTYLSSLILILGAELSSEYGRMATGVERGAQQPHP